MNNKQCTEESLEDKSRLRRAVEYSAVGLSIFVAAQICYVSDLTMMRYKPEEIEQIVDACSNTLPKKIFFKAGYPIRKGLYSVAYAFEKEGK